MYNAKAILQHAFLHVYSCQAGQFCHCAPRNWCPLVSMALFSLAATTWQHVEVVRWAELFVLSANSASRRRHKSVAARMQNRTQKHICRGRGSPLSYVRAFLPVRSLLGSLDSMDALDQFAVQTRQCNWAAQPSADHASLEEWRGSLQPQHVHAYG